MQQPQQQQQQQRQRLSYSQSVALAPMVRVSTLPMRLLALDYGADIVYVEEIIDYRLLATQRLVNSQLGTVDFVQKDGTVVFRTCKRERDRVVLQLGTADPERAVAAARMVENDVAGIDVNMGCPKDYSTKGGMGAALLAQPERAAAILTALAESLTVPVSCKIRILSSTEATVALATRLQQTGISCLAVHGRTRDERPRHPNHNDVIRAVAASLNIPVLANGGSGDIRLPSDIDYFRHVTGCSGVMIGRAAMHNPSVLNCRAGDAALVDSATLVRHYIQYAVVYENAFPQSKYCVQQLLHDRTESKEYRETLSAQTWHEMCKLWNLSSWYAERVRSVANGNTNASKRRLQANCAEDAHEAANQEPLSKRRLAVTEDGEVQASFRFYRRQYRADTSPKMILHSHCLQRKWPTPKYETELIDRLYYSRVIVNGRVYRNLLGDQSKKFGEQSAACLCLVHLGVPDGRKPEAAAAAATDEYQEEKGEDS